MSLSLHTLSPIKAKSGKRIGRGLGSGRGAYSGRGVKGQKARTGGKGGLKLKGMKKNIQQIPKLPGFKSLKAKLAVINLSVLESNFNNGDKVTEVILLKKGLIKSSPTGLKVLGDGTLTKKLNIVARKASASAIAAIEKAGGSIIITNKKKVVDTEVPEAK